VPSPPEAGKWYISKNGSGSNGRTWATAWTELNKIDWSKVQAGDTIYLDGGTTKTDYVSTLFTAKGGTESKRIIITRSNDVGRDGIVSVVSLQINDPYITIDGVDWDKFIIKSQGGYSVRVKGDFFELKNIKSVGNFTAQWGTTIYATAPYLSIEKSLFDGNSNEDMIKYDPPGSGKLTISHSVFMNNQGPADAVHRDVVQSSGGHGFDLEVHHSIFANTKDVFLHQSDGKRFGNFLFYNNIFVNTGDVLKLSRYLGADSVKMYNNVFKNNRDLLGYSTGEFANNIFVGPSHFNGPVHTGGTNIKNSIWTTGTGQYYPGNGNMVADPMFLNPSNVFGPDGKPFTADDGFNLLPGSPAIDKGAPTPYHTDITGLVRKGSWDIGAYEYPESRGQ
jgi:hypothetical protein